MKRGVEMSLQMIVIAVILLLMAAIIIILVGGKLGVFKKSLEDCRSKGGECMSECNPGSFPSGACEDNTLCCVSSSGLDDAFGGG